MKKNMVWMLAGAVSLGCALMAQAADMSGATEKAVAALEQKWAQAQRDNTPELVAPLLAEKYVSIDSDAEVADRAQTLADAKKTKYTTANIDDLKVTAFGDTAIARVLLTYKGTDAKGKAMDEHARWTDTWVKMPSGEWQCVASHGSDLKTK